MGWGIAREFGINGASGVKDLEDSLLGQFRGVGGALTASCMFPALCVCMFRARCGASNPAEKAPKTPTP